VRLARTVLAAALATVTGMFAAGPAESSNRAGSRAAAADAMVQKVNQVRARNGLRPLRPSSSLSSSSRNFAVDLMRQDYLAHRARPSTAGGYRRAGEALAMHSGRADRVSATVGRWMRSPGHRAVLLARGMRELGAGVAHGRWGRSRAVVWVLQVGAR
jgi:uncharacterized protein YkwD